LRDEHVSKQDLLLFVALSECELGQFVCSPSYKQLAKREGVGEKAVRLGVERLAKAGWLSVIPWRNAEGDWDTNTYVLFPRCTGFTMDELRVIRGGSPDPKRKVLGPLPLGADL